MNNNDNDFIFKDFIRMALSSAHNYMKISDPKYQKVDSTINDLTERFTKKEVPNILDCKNDEKIKDSDDNRIVCQICFCNQRNVVYIPCRHILSCNTCSIKIFQTTGKCPYCSQIINKMENIKFP